jgi:hypothetical protein
MRSHPVREAESAWGNYDYTPPKPEQPRRAYAVLRNIARGHAIVHGRQQLSPEDLPLVARVTVSTMPSKCALVFPLVVEHKEVTVSQVQAALGVRHHATARKVMEDLGGRGVMEYVEGDPGRPYPLALPVRLGVVYLAGVSGHPPRLTCQNSGGV